MNHHCEIKLSNIKVDIIAHYTTLGNKYVSTAAYMSIQQVWHKPHAQVKRK